MFAVLLSFIHVSIKHMVGHPASFRGPQTGFYQIQNQITWTFPVLFIHYDESVYGWIINGLDLSNKDGINSDRNATSKALH